MVFFWFNISRLFISHTYIQNFLHFNSPFSPLALLPLYIYLPIVLHVIPCQIHINKNNVIYLQFFDNTYLALTLLSHLILIHMSWLQPRNGGLAITILMLRSNIVDLWVLKMMWLIVGFWDMYFILELKRKRNTQYQLLFYNIPPKFFFFFFFFFSLLQLNNYNIYIYIYIKFIIIAFYDDLISNKVL